MFKNPQSMIRTVMAIMLMIGFGIVSAVAARFQFNLKAATEQAVLAKAEAETATQKATAAKEEAIAASHRFARWRRSPGCFARIRTGSRSASCRRVRWSPGIVTRSATMSGRSEDRQRAPALSRVRRASTRPPDR